MDTETQGTFATGELGEKLLFCIENPSSHPKSWVTEIIPNHQYRVGRSSDNDIVLSHPSISRAQFILSWDCDGLSLQPLASKNQTRVNGAPVSDRIALCPTDRIQVSNVTMTLATRNPGTGPALSGSRPGIYPTEEITIRRMTWSMLEEAVRPERKITYLLLGCALGLVVFYTMLWLAH